ncbi:MAG: TonB-dependent receptor [Chloroherpetonaceae bacterium]|nr:TonB-dependent receptor [Chloroherpetonaceae bacterium]
MTQAIAQVRSIILLGAMLFVVGTVAVAQSGGTLKGLVRDAETKEAVIGASVALHQTKLGAVANTKGYFEIQNIPEGIYEVRISAVGYKTRFKQVHIYDGKVETLEIALQPSSVMGDEVVVSASRYEQNKLDLPITISVIPMKQIDQLPAPSLDRALEAVPGVDVIRSGGIGTSNLQIRGSNGFTGGGLSTRVLMLYDGFPMNSADANSVVWQAVNVSHLERLEVVKGAASAMYGSAAMGGVINAISLLPKEFTVRAKFMNGFYDNPPAGVKPFPGINRPYFYNGNILIGDQQGPLSYSAIYSRISDPGYRDAGQFYSDNINFSARYQINGSQSLQLSSVMNWSHGGVAYGWLNVGNPLGVPPGPVFVNGEPRIVNGQQVIGRFFLSDDETRRESQLVGLTHQVILSSSASWETKIHFNRSYFRILYYPKEDIAFDQFDRQGNFIGNFQRYSFGKVIRRPYDPNDPSTYNDSEARRYGLFSRLLWMRDDHKLSAGIEGAFNDVRSTLYTNSSDFNIGAFFQDEVQLGERFKVTAGLRFDYHRLVPSTVTYV